MFVKVCGMKTREQIDWAVDLGYSAVGVVLHPLSPRFCGGNRARGLAEHSRGRITTVAVGVSFDEVSAYYHDFDYVQIYEFRRMDRLIYAGDEAPAGKDFAFFMFDASRGSGELRALPAWLHDYSDRLIISGGLTPDSVSGVIRTYRPLGVDVSSGVEIARGVKDYNLMERFITEVRNAVE